MANWAFALIVGAGGVICGAFEFSNADPRDGQMAVMAVSIWLAWGVRRFLS